MTNVKLTQMDNQKVAYQAVMVTRDGMRMRFSSEVYKDKDDAAQAIKDHMRKHNRKVIDAGGGIGVEIESTGKEESYDIVKYEIRARAITPWETLEEFDVK